jgi:hypothetical protein
MLREALASAFLQHAVPKGLNFAFVELLGGKVWKGFRLDVGMYQYL